MRPSATLRISISFALALTMLADGAMAQPAQIDPPTRVGRMARLLGTVSFRGADQPEWQAAVINYPVTSGNSFWTEPSSAADVEIGPARLAIDQSTQFDIETLDEHVLQATQAQGASFLRVRAIAEGDIYRITTPRGAVVITQPGAYEIVAGDSDHPTFVTVVEGAARIDSVNASLTLGPRQTGRIEGASQFAASVGPAVMDPFLTARLAQERALARPAAIPQAVMQMTGGEALSSTGNWASSPSYGQIWYPPVQESWVPYRDGHWGYVAPWGWTWIDDAPWGFAPFHYGRWVQDGRRWGWIPVERGAPERLRAAPVYAPALVSFISIGVSLGNAPGRNDPGRSPGPGRGPGDGRGSVGWVPLGPREAYVPPYKASDRYVRAVNVSNVTNVTSINTVTNVTVNNLANRNAATVVPAGAMTGSRPIRAQAEPVDPRALGTARRERSAPVQPTTATSGVTPAVARQLNLAAPAAPVPAPAAAPGPLAPPPAAAPAVVVQSPAPRQPQGNRPAGQRPPERAVPQLPVAVTLPVLRQPVPDAPAHPQPAVPAPAAAAVPVPPASAIAAPPVTVPGAPAAPLPSPRVIPPSTAPAATPAPPPRAAPPPPVAAPAAPPVAAPAPAPRPAAPAARRGAGNTAGRGTRSGAAPRRPAARRGAGDAAGRGTRSGAAPCHATSRRGTGNAADSDTGPAACGGSACPGGRSAAALCRPAAAGRGDPAAGRPARRRADAVDRGAGSPGDRRAAAGGSPDTAARAAGPGRPAGPRPGPPGPCAGAQTRAQTRAQTLTATGEKSSAAGRAAAGW